MRGQSKDYDHWRQLGNIGWGWDAYHFKNRRQFFSDQYHGKGVNGV